MCPLKIFVNHRKTKGSTGIWNRRTKSDYHTPRPLAHCDKRSDKTFGSGGIRTHASEETGALNQRLRPLGHTTSLKILKLVFPKSEMNLLSVFFISSFDSPFLLPLSTIQFYYRQLDLLPCWTYSNFGYKLVHGIPKPSYWDKVYSNVGFDEFWIKCLVTLSGGKCAVTRSTSSLVEFSNLCTEIDM